MTVLPDYPQALTMALSGVEALRRTEDIDLDRAGGRVLAKPISADRDLPPFNRAQMDGYAVRAEELGWINAFPVAHVIAAGSAGEVAVPSGHCVALATGAPLPSDVDTVVPHEWSDRGDQHGDPVRFTIDSIERGYAVHPRGADAKSGDVLIPAGTVLASHHLGLAAAVGGTTITVAARPRASILSSGDEVVAPNRPVLTHQVRNSNAVQTQELLRRFGAEVIRTVHLPDERKQTIAAVGGAIEQSDLVVTIGGVSAGDRDYFPAAFETCGITTQLRGASIQPGRPIVVGRAPSGAIIVGLPGNPVSVLACACLFLWSIVRVQLGLDAALAWREVKLADAVKPNPRRRAFRPAILHADGSVTVPRWAGSGDLAHTAPTHGLVELPVQKEVVAAGTLLRLLRWP